VAHHAPKNSKCKNPLENFSPLFFRIKSASSSLITLQGAKLLTRVNTYLCWCNLRSFWRENASGNSESWSCFWTTNRGSPGTCNTEETDLPWLPVSWSLPYYPDLDASEHHLFPGLKC
jgi:hypothetical protein